MERENKMRDVLLFGWILMFYDKNDIELIS